MMKHLLVALVFFSLSGLVAQENQALEVGQDAPRIQGVDQNGAAVDSDEILKEEKILLVFYRGNWCPYCQKHLASLEKNLVALKEKGIRVLVVSPERAEKTAETSDKLGAHYSIIHDEQNKIMKDYQVLYEVNQDNVPRYYAKVDELVTEYNGADNKVLPIPATYLIGKDGKVAFVHFDPDYSKRSNVEDLIESL